MQQVLVSPTNPRGPKAVALVLADEWTCFLDADGRRSWRVPSASKPGLHYRVSDNGCTCPDLKYRPWLVCKHILAVRLHLELEQGEYAF